MESRTKKLIAGAVVVGSAALLVWLMAMRPPLEAEFTAGADSGAEAGIRVAVASNFAPALEALAHAFEAQTGHVVTPVPGSTGKLYAQIRNGAPFDAFFAADVERPRLLEEEGRAVPGTRFTYAIGTLVLWSPDPDLVDADGAVLNPAEGDAGAFRFRFLALANPTLAPYGKAAEQVLRARGVWDALQDRMVRGENIGQAYQYVYSGNAELGFVALSQLMGPGGVATDIGRTGSRWEPPQALYDPIAQQAVLLTENKVARDFLDFVRSPAARDIIHGYGY
ncbi:MAG: molybdate ABC transporter substrate-binding protein [Rhodothermales bacterium]